MRSGNRRGELTAVGKRTMELADSKLSVPWVCKDNLGRYAAGDFGRPTVGDDADFFEDGANVAGRRAEIEVADVNNRRETRILDGEVALAPDQLLCGVGVPGLLLVAPEIGPASPSLRVRGRQSAGSSRHGRSVSSAVGPSARTVSSTVASTVASARTSTRCT